MLANQFLPIFGVIVAFAAFSQGFMGLGFGIITIAGLGFMPGIWSERPSLSTCG